MSEFTEGVTAPVVQPEVVPPTEGPASYLADLVGEGKSYTTVEEAAEALAKKASHADKHIETLIAEKKAIELQYQEISTKTKSIDEVLAAINEQNIQEPVVPKVEGTSTQQLTLDDVDAYFKQQGVAQEKKASISKSWERLASEGVFGSIDKAKQAVALYIKDNPARKALVDSMAVADPDGLIRILKPDVSTVTFTESHEGVKFEGLPSGKLTWAMADKVKKENSKLYYSPAFRKKMQEELI